MFTMGTEMSVKDFEGVLKMPKAVIIGLISHFTIMPLVAVTLATTFGFPSEIAAGMARLFPKRAQMGLLARRRWTRRISSA